MQILAAQKLHTKGKYTSIIQLISTNEKLNKNKKITLKYAMLCTKLAAI